MNRKSIILSAWLLTSAAHAFAQQEVSQESTFLNTERVTIRDGRDSMNITIKGRLGEPDFTFSRTVMYPSDEVTVTRERRTHPDFSIPFGINSVKDKEGPFEMKGTRSFVANGFECKISTDSTVSISRMPVAYLTDAVTDSVFHIPSFVEYEGKTYQVTRIAEKGFAGNIDIKHLVIDEGVKIIDFQAFICCYNLESVRIPASLSFIGNSIFGSCYNLKSIIVDSANTELDSRENCNAVIQTENDILLAGCATSRIPEGVKAIDDFSFDGCINLKHISLPQSLEYIGNFVFGGCTSLQSVVIPRNVEDIGRGLFGDCNQLKSITVEDGNEYYDSRQNCNAIIHTETNKLVAACAGTRLIEGIEKIGGEAFYGVPLYELHIPKSVTSAEQWAFEDCRYLKSITVDKDNPAYTSPAGSNVLLTKDGKTLIKGCSTSVIPQGVTTIGEGAFWGVNLFTYGFLSIPKGVKTIEDRAFHGCTNLYHLIVPSSVETIGEHAFAACPDLNGVLLKGEVKELGPYAFANSERLGIIQLPEGMTTIKDGAFSGCTNLYGINLPSSLQEVGRNAFKDCPCEKEVLQLVQKNKK